jgi:hypothetical protein
MRGVDNITLSPDTNNIELRQHSIRERSELRRQAGLAQTHFCNGKSGQQA